MNIDVLFLVENGLIDADLTSGDIYVPDILREKIRSVSSSTRFFYSVPEDYTGRIEHEQGVFRRSETNDLELWKKIFREISSSHIAVIKADSLFFDPEIFTGISEIHLKYLAEFTFSENLPDGFSCEIYSADLINQLPEVKEKTLPLDRVIKSNINQFDVELFYMEPDIRDKRINFRLSSNRERKIMESICRLIGGIPRYRDIRGLIESNPEVLFAGPSYVELEITGACSLDCIFCYRKSLKKQHGSMDRSTLVKILVGMREFALPYTLCFGGSGEPLDHPEFYAFMDIAVSEKLVEQIVIETSGIKADMNFKSYVEKPENSKIKVIVNNNAMDNRSYSRFHGGDCYTQVFNNIISLSELNRDGDRVYVQVMKINETDEFETEGDTKTYLDRFYDFWEKNSVPIILQKQNVYLGRITDRRYSDLSPIKRVPCWHLQRDIYVLSDGTVAFCKQDIDGEKSHGNIASMTLQQVWDAQKKYFVSDYSGKLCQSPDCSSCDEWYTFNF